MNVMSRLRPLLVAATLAATTAAPVRAAAPFNSSWFAGGGVLPSQACPAWTAVATDSTPQLTGGTLRVHTTACAKNAFFMQRDTSIAIPDTLVVEARLRFASGSECVGPCGHYRQAASLAVTTAPDVGVLFFVGDGELLLTSSECAAATTVPVPTADAAHTYRLTILPGGAVSVTRDGALVLSGHTYTSSADHGSLPRVLWGEGTSLANGTTYWEWVRHNAHATGCTTAGVAPDPRPSTGPVSALHAWPNPSRGTARIDWTLGAAASTRVTVFDLGGRMLRTLHEGALAAGPHRVDWDGRDDAGRPVPPGAYLCRVATPGGEAVTRVIRAR